MGAKCYPHVFVNKGFGCGYVSFIVRSLWLVVLRPNREPKTIRSLNPNRKTMNGLMPKSQKPCINKRFRHRKILGTLIVPQPEPEMVGEG
jgi:hypothetical protein